MWFESGMPIGDFFACLQEPAGKLSGEFEAGKDRDEAKRDNERQQRDHEDIGRHGGKGNAMEVNRHWKCEPDLDGRRYDS